jgi:hypothetical protein
MEAWKEINQALAHEENERRHGKICKRNFIRCHLASWYAKNLKDHERKM